MTRHKAKLGLVVLSMILLAMLLLAWPGVSHSQDVKLELATVWESTGDIGDLGPLANVNGLTEAATGDIWIADGRLDRLVVLSSDGTDARMVAARGQGPGELEGASLLTAMGEHGVAAYDAVRGSIEIFSLSGEFVRRIQTRATVSFAKGFVSLESGYFVISGGLPGRGASLHLISPGGAIERSWGYAPYTENPRADMLAAGGPVTVLSSRSLLFSVAARNRLENFAFSAGGIPQAEGNVLVDDTGVLSEPTAESLITETYEDGALVREFNPFFPQSVGLFEVQEGIVLNIIVLFSEGRSLWQFFDIRSGTKLFEQEVAGSYKPWDMTRNRELLVTHEEAEDMEIRVARLRMNLSTLEELFRGLDGRS